MIRTALLASCLLVVPLLVGCNNTIKSSDLRDDWTPEVKSLTLSDEELKNFRSRHVHNRWRQFHDDWSMIWLMDRNSRLTEYNLP